VGVSRGDPSTPAKWRIARWRIVLQLPTLGSDRPGLPPVLLVPRRFELIFPAQFRQANEALRTDEADRLPTRRL
jgi:hypothetical protein